MMNRSKIVLTINQSLNDKKSVSYMLFLIGKLKLSTFKKIISNYIESENEIIRYEARVAMKRLNN